jgi:hypothetical protein
MAARRADADRAFETFVATYQAKYPSDPGRSAIPAAAAGPGSRASLPTGPPAVHAARGPPDELAWE